MRVRVCANLVVAVTKMMLMKTGEDERKVLRRGRKEKGKEMRKEEDGEEERKQGERQGRR